MLASPTYLQLWKTVSHVDSRECRKNSDFSQTFLLDAAVRVSFYSEGWCVYILGMD